jgi:HAD superfamily hydrolase (TIGR01509 family)
MTTPRAVLFDLDGTLYHQLPVRTLMAAEMAAETAVTSLSAPPGRLVRTLHAFRQVREELRHRDAPTASLEALQFEQAAERCGQPAALVADLVDEWMFRRPLKYIAHFKRSRVIRLITQLRQRNVALGVLSDYPVSEKLAVLDLTDAFRVTLCTTDPDINAFKPHPKGFLTACERLDLHPREVVYVGDRADVDAVGARAAGMACYLVGGSIVPTWFKEKAGSLGSGKTASLERLYHSIA